MAHKCSYAALYCVDFRFREATRKFLDDNFGTTEYDQYSFPGAQKALVDPSSRDIVLGWIGVSANLHSAKKIVVIAHMDCGAYGGSTNFSNVDEERNAMISDLHTARDIVQKEYPELEVELRLLTLTEDGKPKEFEKIN